MVVAKTKNITTQQMLLINRIRQCMITDEINKTSRLPYNNKWVHKFLSTIELKGRYTEEQGKILMEIRDSFLDSLQSLYDMESLKIKLNENNYERTTKISGKFLR